MTLEKILRHIVSSGFWRLMSLVLKRGFSVAKVVLQKLPPALNPILYFLHFLRAFLRVVSFFRSTRNKNLGETRKLFFSLFKIGIAVAALVFLFVGYSIPASLLFAFFAYSIVKLIDSSGVFLFSLAAFFKIDEGIENKWRKEQYRDNLVKHASILAIGVSVTIVTAVFVAGVGVLAWSSPFLIVLLASIGMFTLLSGAALWVYSRRCRSKNVSQEVRSEYSAYRKLLIACVVFGFLSLALATTAPLFATSAIGIAIALLNSLDAIKSIYDYFCDAKVPDSSPCDLAPKNSLVDLGTIDYYASKERVLFLKTIRKDDDQKKQEEIIRSNKLLLLKEGLVKLVELQNKRLQLHEKKSRIFSFLSEEEKITIKQECLTRELAWALKDERDHSGTKLISLLLEAIFSLYEDKALLKMEGSSQALTFKTRRNMANITILPENSDELLEYVKSYEDKCIDKKTTNVLMNLFIAYQNQQGQAGNTDKPKQFYQSFWKKRGDCEDLSLFFKAAKYIEEVGLEKRNFFRLNRSNA